MAAVYDSAVTRSFIYLIDGLNVERGQRLKSALEHVPDITGVVVRPNHGVIQVEANRDPEEQVRMACTVVGIAFRVKMKRRNLF